MNFPAIKILPEKMTRIGGVYIEPVMPWEINNAYAASNTFDLSATDGLILSLEISPDGQELYVLGDVTKTVYQYTLCSPYDLSTAQFTDSLPLSGETTTAKSIRFMEEGILLLVASTGGGVTVYKLGTAYDISTAVYTVASDFIIGETTVLAGITIGNDDSVLYALDSSGDVYEYTLSYSDPVVSIVASGTVDLGATTGDSSSIQIHGEGKKLFVSDDTSRLVYIINLPNFYQVINAVYGGTFLDLSAIVSGSVTFIIAYDGFSLYFVDGSTSIIHEYSME